MGMLWIQQTRVQSRLVAQQEQALGIRIESAQWIHAFRERKVGQRPPARALFGRELRENAVRFVKREEHGLGRSNAGEKQRR